MSADASEGVAPLATADPTVYNAYIAGLAVRDVEVVRVYAERHATVEPSEVKFDTALGYARQEGAVNYRYDVTARLVDAEGSDVARVEVAAVLVTESTSPSDEATVAQFAGTSGAMIAFPFLREAIATTAQRIGYPGVLMPIIRTNPDAPSDSDHQDEG
jgi:preprotein translocase subunit SecB